MNSSKTVHQIVVVLAGMATGVAAADTLEMKNGSVVIGTLISADRDNVVFETPFAGQITIKQANIDSIETDETVTLMMESGTIYRDKLIRLSDVDQQMVVMTEGEKPVVYDIVDIDTVNPEPWLLGEGYKWSGNASLALESERGNTDTDEWDIGIDTVWRSLDDRYTIRGNMELDEANGEKNTDNWKLMSKYDRFFEHDQTNYWGVKAQFEYDKFADLDLRTIIGPHIGRKFFDTSLLEVEGEVGPVWVDEQFDEAEDNDWPGAMWVLRGESDIIGFGTTLYVHHDGIFNFDETDELILNTTVGIKLPMIFGLETAIEAKYEYDGGAVEGVDDTDETYNIRVGYSW
jgi:putative salt-induced outer membrane protein YdiY